MNINLQTIRREHRETFLDMLTDDTVNKTYMLPDFATREDAIPLFERLMALSEDTSRFVRCICCGETAVGMINDVETKDGKVELGYLIHPSYQNKGYMTEGLKIAIGEMLGKGFQEVICGAFEGNRASMRVMEKCGMQRIDYSDTVEYRGQTKKCIYYTIKKENDDA